MGFGEGVGSEIAAEMCDVESRRGLLRTFLSNDANANAASMPFRGVLRFLGSVRDAFEAELAEQLAKAVTARLVTMPQRTFRERKDAVDVINGAAHRLRLATSCPKTGKACTMDVQTTGAAGDAGVLYAKHLADPTLGVDPVIGDEIRSVQFVKLPATTAYAGLMHAPELRGR